MATRPIGGIPRMQVGSLTKRRDIHVGIREIRSGSLPGATIIVTYLMAARDPDCAGPLPTYRYWTVTGEPDFDASEYIGARCGATPLADIVVLDKR